METLLLPHLAEHLAEADPTHIIVHGHEADSNHPVEQPTDTHTAVSL
jgi:hypothetical protein